MWWWCHTHQNVISGAVRGGTRCNVAGYCRLSGPWPSRTSAAWWEGDDGYVRDHR